MPSLIVEWPDGKRTAFAVDGSRVTLGRNPSNTITIDNKYISGYHAEFRLIAPGRYEIMDLDSFNGTFVNGNPAKKREVQDGDRLLFGLVKAEFRLKAPTADAGVVISPQKSASSAPHPEILDTTQPVRPIAMTADGSHRPMTQGPLTPGIRPETHRVATLSATNKQVAEFEAKLNEARKEAEQLRRQLEETKTHGLKVLDEEKTQVRQELAAAQLQAKKESEAAALKLQDSQKLLQEAQQKIAASQKDLEAKAKDLAQAQQERDEARRRVANAKQLTAEAEDARIRLEKTEKELTTRRDELAKLTRDLDQARLHRKNEDEATSKARTEKESHEKSLKPLQDAIAAAEKQRQDLADRLQKETGELAQQTQLAKTRLAEAQAAIDPARKELETLQIEHKNAAAETDKLRSGHKTLTEELARTRSQIPAHQEELKRLQQAVTNARREKDETVAKANQETSQIQAELQSLLSEAEKARQESAHQLARMQEAEDRFREFDAKIEKLRLQERSLTEHLQMLHRQQFLAEKRQKELEALARLQVEQGTSPS